MAIRKAASSAGPHSSVQVVPQSDYGGMKPLLLHSNMIQQYMYQGAPDMDTHFHEY